MNQVGPNTPYCSPVRTPIPFPPHSPPRLMVGVNADQPPNPPIHHLLGKLFTPEVFVPIKTGSMCKHIIQHPFSFSMVKEAESWVYELLNTLLSVANEQLLHLPKPLKALFSTKFY